jgi:hypothetical protein
MLEQQASGGSGYDWTVVLLSGWFVGGLFLDGWAHHHIPELESFFTPWHAVFYTGFLAVAGFLMATLVRNHAKGYPWRHAMPPGYELAVMGVLIFMYVQAKKPDMTARRFGYVEGGACFWHMVDLLWIVLFPLLCWLAWWYVSG